MHAEAGCSRPTARHAPVANAFGHARRRSRSIAGHSQRSAGTCRGELQAVRYNYRGEGPYGSADDDEIDDHVPLNASFDAEDMPPILADDWREFRARLVAHEVGTSDDERVQEASSENLRLLQEQNPKLASAKPWAHRISLPEKGCLLVASETQFMDEQQYFHQAVILLLEHGEEGGSMGVILNRPTQYNMGYVSGDSEGVFAENALYFGGDVGDGTVSFLHGNGQVEGTTEVTPGVFLGGYEHACEVVKEGRADATDFKFFARYCGWAPGQLEGEVKRGMWYPVACCKELTLKQVIQLPKPLWREILELCGGDLFDVSQAAYNETVIETINEINNNSSSDEE